MPLEAATLAFETFFGVPGLFAAAFALAAFVIASLYVSPGQTKAAFLLLSVGAGLYGMGDGLARIAAVAGLGDEAASWLTFRFVGLTLVPAALLHFAGAYTGLMASRSFRLLLLTIYLVAALFVPLRLFTPLVFGSLAVSGGVIRGTAGPDFYVFSLYALSCALAAFALLEGKARAASSLVEARDLRRCAVGAALPFVTGTAYVALFRESLSPTFDPTVAVLPLTVAILGATFIARETLFSTLGAMRAAFGQMPDGLVVLDPKGMATFANRAATGVMAPSGGALVGQPFLAVLGRGALPPKAQKSLEGALREVSSNRSQMEVLEIETGPPASRSIRAVVTAAEVGGFSGRYGGLLGGRDRFILLSLHDDTDVRARGLLLAKANEVKDLFITMIGHDLKAPLNAIMGYSELIGLDSQSAPDALAVYRYSQAIHASAQQMQLIMENARLLSRLADPQDMLRNRQPLAIAQMVEREAANLRGPAERRRVRVEVEVEPSAKDARVMGAPIMRSVFQNLIDNGVKYTGEGTQVSLRVSVDAKQVVVTVEDQGPGVPAEQRAAVFQRFTRLEQTRTKTEGMGLGLSISKQLVDLHGGTLTIEDRKDKTSGACFRVCLPLEPAVA